MVIQEYTLHIHMHRESNFYSSTIASIVREQNVRYEVMFSAVIHNRKKATLF